MSGRYDDRDNERGGQRNYGRRSGGEYDRSYNQSSQGGYGRGFEDERDRYSSESRWRGQYGGRTPYRSGSEYQASREDREDYGNEGWESNYSGQPSRTFGTGRALGADYGLGYGGSQGGYGERSGNDYGSSGLGYGGAERGYEDYRGYRSEGSYGGERGGYGSERGYGGRRGSMGSGGSSMGSMGSQRGGYMGGSGGRYSDESSSGYSQRSNYPRGQSWGESYGGRGSEYSRSGEYGRGSDYGRGGEYGGEERGWWDRASDEVASWFGDEEAERRRRMDAQRPHKGKGPKGYRRSDERIKEDINDRLSEGYIDASDINVEVSNGEVTLTGTVSNRSDKRRAEDIAEYVSGVSNVENRIRVKDNDANRYSSLQQTGMNDTSTTSATGTSATGTGSTGTTGTGSTGTGATGTGATGTGATGTSGSTGTSARGRTAGSGSSS